MRKFICRPFGYEVDLDDPETYSYLPDNVKELKKLMLSEIGYSYCYMNYWHKEFFGDNRDGGQKERVEQLVKLFTEEYRNRHEDVLWYKEQVFIFQNEIENMC